MERLLEEWKGLLFGEAYRKRDWGGGQERSERVTDMTWETLIRNSSAAPTIRHYLFSISLNTANSMHKYYQIHLRFFPLFNAVGYVFYRQVYKGRNCNYQEQILRAGPGDRTQHLLLVKRKQYWWATRAVLFTRYNYRTGSLTRLVFNE